MLAVALLCMLLALVLVHLAGSAWFQVAGPGLDLAQCAKNNSWMSCLVLALGWELPYRRALSPQPFVLHSSHVSMLGSNWADRGVSSVAPWGRLGHRALV